MASLHPITPDYSNVYGQNIHCTMCRHDNKLCADKTSVHVCADNIVQSVGVQTVCVYYEQSHVHVRMTLYMCR